MFRGSLFRELEDDPFFAAHRQHISNMNRMFMDPFGNFGQQGMIEDRRDRRSDGRSRAVQPRNDDPFGMGMFDSMFSNMRNMMSNMHQQIETSRSDPNSQMFSQSSFMSYSNTGNGPPKVYQASTSTRKAPGGIKEVKKMERDSESGLEKMAIGHHINDRGHVIQRERNRRTGDEDETQEFINIDDNQAREFDREWSEKTRQFQQGSQLEYARRGERSDRRREQRPQRAIEGPRRKEKHSYRDRD